MKKLLLLFIFVVQSFAALSVEELTWDNGDTLLKFYKEIPYLCRFIMDLIEKIKNLLLI